MKALTLTHTEAMRRAGNKAQDTLRVWTADWDNSEKYVEQITAQTEETIKILLDPTFMNKPTFFTHALDDEDRALCADTLRRYLQLEIQDEADRQRLRAA